MMIIKVRKAHKCIVCKRDIVIGEEALRVYVDNHTSVGRQYYCKECANSELQNLLKMI